MLKQGHVTSGIVLVVIVGLVMFHMFWARRSGRLPALRKIAGLDVLEEAVGRATEMDKPIIVVPGRAALSTVEGSECIAGLSVLYHVGRLSARYGAKIVFAQGEPDLYVAGSQILRQAYAEEGQSEALKPENMRFITQDRWGFVSGLLGIMYREGVASAVFTGSFGAESLVLAETAASLGAIQVAGTANLLQIPFWIAAADYVLIGEELYAAGAYLSRDPILVGGLRGQDLAKIAAVIGLVIGSVLVTGGLTEIVKFLKL